MKILKKILSLYLIIISIFTAIACTAPHNVNSQATASTVKFNTFSSKNNDITFMQARLKRRIKCLEQKTINFFNQTKPNNSILIPIGIAAYQNVQSSENFNTIKNNPNIIKNLITIKYNSISSSDRFLFYVIFESDYGFNTRNTINKTQSSITISLELYLETTKVLTFVIYEDLDGNYIFSYVNITQISFNNQNNQVIINDIKTNKLNTIKKITINYDDNLSTIKK